MSLLKVTTWTLMGAGIASMIGLNVLSAYLLGHRRPAPQPELGFTYALQQHGVVVYVTRTEHLLMASLPWAFVLLAFSALAIRANSRSSRQ